MLYICVVKQSVNQQPIKTHKIMNELEKKMIEYHLGKLEEVADKLEKAEQGAEKSCAEVENREFPSAFKYGHMIAETRICSGLITNQINDLRRIINNL